MLMFPSLVFQTSFPVAASTAQVWPIERVDEDSAARENCSAIHSVSQQATPWEAASGLGLYVHLNEPLFVRSRA